MADHRTSGEDYIHTLLLQKFWHGFAIGNKSNIITKGKQNKQRPRADDSCSRRRRWSCCGLMAGWIKTIKWKAPHFPPREAAFFSYFPDCSPFVTETNLKKRRSVTVAVLRLVSNFFQFFLFSASSKLGVAVGFTLAFEIWAEALRTVVYRHRSPFSFHIHSEQPGSRGWFHLPGFCSEHKPVSSCPRWTRSRKWACYCGVNSPILPDRDACSHSRS